MNTLYNHFRPQEKGRELHSLLLQADILETDFGLIILEEVVGEPLTHKGQKVHFEDQSHNSAEVFYPAGRNGKPTLYNHSTGENWFPINAYAEHHGLSWKQAVDELSARFLTEEMSVDVDRRAKEQQQEKTPKPQTPPSLHDANGVAKSISPKYYEKNNFARYVRRLFGKEVADKALQRFNVGTATWHFRGTVFWQRDLNGHYRAGKIIAYIEPTGKRRQEVEYTPRWAHEIQRLPDFNLTQCLFGEHQLLSRPDSPIGICESEKTAIISSILLSETVWLATGGSGNLGLIERCPALRDRIITLWPDLDPQFKFYKQWEKKAEELRRKGFDVEVSQYLRDNSTVAERQDKMDLADFLAGPKDRCPETGRLLTYNPVPLTPPTRPLIVSTLADWAENPGSILRPAESEIERLVIEQADELPVPEPVSALDRMKAKNPALDLLMDTLDLEFVETPNDCLVNWLYISEKQLQPLSCNANYQHEKNIYCRAVCPHNN